MGKKKKKRKQTWQGCEFLIRADQCSRGVYKSTPQHSFHVYNQRTQCRSTGALNSLAMRRYIRGQISSSYLYVEPGAPGGKATCATLTITKQTIHQLLSKDDYRNSNYGNLMLIQIITCSRQDVRQTTQITAGNCMLRVTIFTIVGS